MSVKSVRLEDNPRKASAVISRAAIARWRGAVERSAAFGVLFLSFLGTIVSFHGGWTPLLELRPSLAAILGGLLTQAILTWLQWSYRHNRPLCWGSRLVDTTFTAVGFGPLFVGALSAWLVGRGWSAELAVSLPYFGATSTAAVGAWSIIALVSLGAAWYPESRLVD